MNRGKLQVFIEDNIGKSYGDMYKYGMVLLGTRYRGGVEGQPSPGVEVSLAIPQGFGFSMIVETDLIGTAVDFFEWLTDKFFPAMNEKWAEIKEDKHGTQEHHNEQWYEVKACMQCPLKYKTGTLRMCSLGSGEIPQAGIHRNCRVIRPYVKLMACKQTGYRTLSEVEEKNDCP